ncbi:DNA polymerase subunit Cdc27 [Vararia minispora EC-137]|uniref:DNA polymerase subunit Cdc27 n=1 Tax=Vararia minispora EC-137 TaxID=1314806 RepID=A0ACB8Q780_9AGAM|nr:DNA polymerase subunit Cdc27 [Vararia minispora EC-137]
MTDAATDYLIQQIFVEKNVVTYRSLSRALGIHVNAAKNELAHYHAAFRDAPERGFASYLITGTPHPSARDEDENMEADPDARDAVESMKCVRMTRVILANEDMLEVAQAKYAHISSIHVYSLAPSPLRDPALLREPTRIVYEIDKQRDADFALAVGRVTGPHVKRGPIKKSKAPPPPATASSSKAKFPVKEVKEERMQEEKKVDTKTLKTGKLDFSRSGAKLVKKEEKPVKEDAKPSKETKPMDEKKPVKEEQRPKKRESADHIDDELTSAPLGAKFGPPRGKKKAADAQAKVQAFYSFLSSSTRFDDVIQRGTKRKSAITLSDSEPEPTPEPTPPPATASSPASSPPTAFERPRRRGVVLDSDEEAEVPAKGKRKGKMSAAEKAVAAMMDIDDDTVDRVARTRKHPHPAAEEEDQEDQESRFNSVNDEDVEMLDDPVPAPKVKTKTKRKPKKEVPVGRNGLKKRRVVKQRISTDQKGFVVAEDYSSYESVSEEEPEPLKEERGKKKAGGADARKESKGTKRELTKKGLGSTGGLVRAGSGQQSLRNFFQPK